MGHLYKALSIAEMAQQTSVSPKIINRIQELVNSHKISIRASKEGHSFVAYAGDMPLSRKAVLHIKTRVRHIVIETDKRPKDMLSKIAEILTNEAKVFGAL